MLRAAGVALLVLVSSLLALPAVAAQAKVEKQPTPAWVLPAPVQTGLGPVANGGVAVLVSDEQSRIVGDEVWNFRRYHVQLLNEVGVQSMGELKLDFVPSHERLVVHSLVIRRGSEVIPKTESQRFEVIKREAELESQGVYDGKCTALALLSDLRVGDVLEYEYSIIGRNPVFGPHHGHLWFTREPSAVGFLRRRQLTDHVFTLVQLGELDAPLPEPERSGGLYDYRYTATRVQPAVLEDRAPYDFVPRALGVVELTDSASWQDVVAWGRALFKLPLPAAPAVRELASRLRFGPREASVLAVVQAIQTDVRYLSLALNEGTHRPAAPAVVLDRHFGDCKDKSLLVVALLHELGIDAEPALVSTSLRGDIAKLAPGPGLFDHAIVHVHLGEEDYFVDPTLTQQRGTLEEIAVHDYGYALTLAAGITAPVPIPPRQLDRPDIDAEITLNAATSGATATLDCKTTFRHESAVALRRFHATSQTPAFEQALASDIARVFPRASRVGELGFADAPSRNEISVLQRFEVPDAWSAATGERRLIVVPPWQATYVEPLGTARRAPLAINYPRRVVHKIAINLPAAGHFAEETRKLEEGPFRFELAVTPRGSQLELIYDLSTREARVEPTAFEAYRETLSKLARESSFVITLTPSAPPHFPTWTAVLLTAWTPLLVGALVYVHRYQPYMKLPSVPFVPRLRGLRGWLVLVGINVTITPLSALGSLMSVAKTYRSLSMGPDAAGHRAIALAKYAENAAIFACFAVFLLIVGTYTAYLYLARRRSFPLLFAIVMGMNTVFALGLFAFTPAAATEHPGVPGRGVSDFSPILWVAYAMRSKRMKATFLPEPVEDVDEADKAGEFEDSEGEEVRD
jgi:hypothetical protein